jgi:hypothetical protein
MDMGNYDGMPVLNRLCFRMNLIKEISGISTNTALTELDLYDNMLQRIENVEVLACLTTRSDVVHCARIGAETEEAGIGRCYAWLDRVLHCRPTRSCAFSTSHSTASDA